MKQASEKRHEGGIKRATRMRPEERPIETQENTEKIETKAKKCCESLLKQCVPLQSGLHLLPKNVSLA